MADTVDEHADRQLQLLCQLVAADAPITGEVARISDDIWAIYGVIPVDGGVILAEFGTYDQARIVLDQVPTGSHINTDR